MGDDLSVVNAARVSFDKESAWSTEYYSEYDGSESILHTLEKRDAKLIHYLAKHRHKSPFNHAFAKFRVKAPIFVARQLVKHEYLIWNEVSRRYVDSEPEFYYPETWRERPTDKKQGSGKDIDLDVTMHFSLGGFHILVLEAYEKLLEIGVAPEQARMILPQSLMTEWIWSGSLYAFAKMCALRLSPDSQYESRLVAEQIDTEMSLLFPVSWNALKGNIV